MLLQDPRQVGGSHKTITNKCSYKTRGRSTEHTKQLQTNALTRPEAGRRSTQNNYKQMLLQDPRQVDGAHKTITNKCSYKTRGRSTEHTKQLQTNALTRPEAGRRSTQNNYKQMLLQDPRQVDGAHKIITNKCSYKTRGRLTEHTKQL